MIRARILARKGWVPRMGIETLAAERAVGDGATTPAKAGFPVWGLRLEMLGEAQAEVRELPQRLGSPYGD